MQNEMDTSLQDVPILLLTLQRRRRRGSLRRVFKLVEKVAGL